MCAEGKSRLWWPVSSELVAALKTEIKDAEPGKSIMYLQMTLDCRRGDSPCSGYNRDALPMQKTSRQ